MIQLIRINLRNEEEISVGELINDDFIATNSLHQRFFLLYGYVILIAVFGSPTTTPTCLIATYAL